MTTTLIKDNLIAQLDRLPHDLQLRVLDFIKALIPKGVEGKAFCALKELFPPMICS